MKRKGQNDPQKKTLFRRKLRESCVNLTFELILLASCAYADKTKSYNKKEKSKKACDGLIAYSTKNSSWVLWSRKRQILSNPIQKRSVNMQIGNLLNSRSLTSKNRKTTAQLLEVLAKFEGRYSYKKMHGSRNSGNVERRGWNESRRSNHDDRQRNWRNSKVLHTRPSNGRNIYRGNYEFGRQRKQWFENRNELNRDDRRFDRGYQSGNRVQSENFRRGDRRNRG
ncbi:uncharacterized protein TNCV_1834841 [Trichonephila clavipes]|nr:uncharacterized protein TNCV_1834841 [Trichonephila clavipes]